MITPPKGPHVSLSRFARRNAQTLILAGAASIFLIGAVAAFVYRPGSSSDAPSIAGTINALPSRTVGPNSGQDIAQYIAGRRSALDLAAHSDPRATVEAAVSFSSFKKPADAQAFIRRWSLTVTEVQIRIPLPGFKQESYAVSAGSIALAVAPGIGNSKIAALREELKSLEEIIPTVQDPEYERVYKADVDLHRKAIALLTADPSVVYVVVVKATNAQLKRAWTDPSVRVIDVDEAHSGARVTFRGIDPADGQTVGSGA